MKRLSLALAVIGLAAAGASLAQNAAPGPEAVYRAYQKALQTEDWSKIKPFVAAATVKAMEGLRDMKRGLRRTKEMQPHDVTILKQEITGSTARLETTGQRDGEPYNGAIELAREGGVWKIVKERWRPASMDQPSGAAPQRR